MWGLPWEKGRYRLENLDQRRLAKIRQGERAQCALRPPIEHLCQNCHKEPAAFAAMGGLCVECSDYILD